MRTPVLALVLPALLLASTAAAQTLSLDRRVGDGLPLPSAPVSGADSPLAGATNPAAVGFGRFGLDLLHLEGDPATSSGDGLFVGGALAPGVGLGLSGEWQRPGGGLDGPREFRSSFVLALGGANGSLGLAARRVTAAHDAALDGAVTYDAGVLLRPASWGSIGFSASALNAPELGDGRTIPRRYRAGVGARPAGELLTLSAELDWRGGEGVGPSGPAEGALGYEARLLLFDGLALTGSYAHGLASDEQAFGVGLSAETDVLAIGGAVGGPSDAPGLWLQGSLWAPDGVGLDLSPTRRVAVVELSQALGVGGGTPLFAGETRNAVLDLVTGLDALATDPRYDATVLLVDDADGLSFAVAEELRDAIRAHRARGGRIYALLFGGGDAAYVVAAACDELWASRGAALMVNGISARTLFYADTLAKIGVSFEAVRVGPHKTAPDALTRAFVSEEQKALVDRLVAVGYRHVVESLAADRRRTPDEIKRALDAGITSATRAKELGLVDRVVFPDELEGLLEERLGGKVELERMLPRARPYLGWGAAPAIAIIPVEGMILMGRSGRDPLGFARTTGAESVIAALEAAAKDDNVKAIVLRIDSGGGDAHASDLMWRAAKKAAEKKPIIASMGGAAASGGYYVAAGAEKIFAAPSTITGSIGVFAMKPAINGLTGMLGVGQHKAEAGAAPRIVDLFEPWTEAERAGVQRYVDEAYTDFVGVVAEARGKKPEEIEAIARGRVWAGEEAKANGLVDDLGGLAAALAFARERAGIEGDEPVDYPVLAPAQGLLSFSASSGLSYAPPSPIPATLARALSEAIPAPLRAERPAAVWALAESEVRWE